MSQIRRSFEWLRVQWNNGGGGKRVAIVVSLLFLWPFVLMYGLVALVFEIVASLDRSGRFSTKAHWAIATLLVVGGLTVVSAASPNTEPTNGAEATAKPSAAAVEASVATPIPSIAPSAAPAATPDATEMPEITPAPAADQSVDVWSRDTAVTLMEAEGFSGKESPLLDGTPRWLAKDGSSGMAEVIGSDRVSTVSMTVVANEANGEMLGRLVNTWCPSGTSWVTSTIGSYSGTDIDEAKSFSGCSVNVQTITATDGALVIVSIDG